MNVEHPLDKKLSRLYQQRKQQLQMPDTVNEGIVDKAKPVKKHRTGRLSRPTWASTLIACFVIVISYHFLSIDLVSDDPYAPQTIAADDGASVVEVAPEPIIAQQEPMMAQQGDFADEAIVVQSRGADVKSSAQPQRLEAREQFDRKKTERMARAKMAVLPTTVFVRILLTEEKGQYSQGNLRYAKDCHGKTIAIDHKWLDGISANDWVEVRYNSEREISKVTLLRQAPEC